MPEQFRGIRLFEFRGNKEFAGRSVVLDAQNIGFAANLAIFDVRLPAPRRLVDRGNIPLPAGGALETGFHPDTWYSLGCRVRRLA